MIFMGILGILLPCYSVERHVIWQIHGIHQS
jgi:hypothetical protein